MFAGSSEIQAYLLRCVEKYGLRAAPRPRHDDRRGALRRGARRLDAHDEPRRARRGARGRRRRGRPRRSEAAPTSGPRRASRGEDVPHGALGPRLRSRREARRRDRHRGERRAGRAGDRADGREAHVFQRTPAWVVPKRDQRYQRARAGALPQAIPWLLRAPPARAVRLQRAHRADDLPRCAAALADRRAHVDPAPREQRAEPRAPRQAPPALPVRLQAHADLRRLLGDLRARRTSSS